MPRMRIIGSAFGFSLAVKPHESRNEINVIFIHTDNTKQYRQGDVESLLQQCCKNNFRHQTYEELWQSMGANHHTGTLATQKTTFTRPLKKLVFIQPLSPLPT